AQADLVGGTCRLRVGGVVGGQSLDLDLRQRAVRGAPDALAVLCGELVRLRLGGKFVVGDGAPLVVEDNVIRPLGGIDGRTLRLRRWGAGVGPQVHPR